MSTKALQREGEEGEGGRSNEQREKEGDGGRGGDQRVARFKPLSGGRGGAQHVARVLINVGTSSRQHSINSGGGKNSREL